MSAQSARGIEFTHLDVVRLGRHDWRVSDNSLDDSSVAVVNPARLVGFIERLKRGQFEVLWMSDPMEWAYTASFEAALAALAGSDSFVGVRRGSRDRLIETAPARPFGPVRRRMKSVA